MRTCGHVSFLCQKLKLLFLQMISAFFCFLKCVLRSSFDLNKHEKNVQGYSAYPWAVSHLNTDNIFLILETDTIAQRGERLELLIDKAEDLNTSVSSQ